MKMRSSMKKLVTLLTAIAVLLTSIVVYQPQTAEAASKNRIELEKKYTSLYVGESYNLKAKDIYQNGQKVTSTDNSKLSWKYFKFTSSKKSVATVSKKGVVTAKKKGKTTITMTSIYNSKVKATIRLTVKAKAKKTKIEMVSKKATVFVGNATTLKVKKVTGLSGEEVKFSSSDKKIATVNSKGVVVGKKVGTAKITVTSALNKKAKTTVKITVTTKDMEDTVYNPSGEAKIVLAENEVTLAPTDSFPEWSTGCWNGPVDWGVFYQEERERYGMAQIKIKSITGVKSKAVSYTSSDSTIAEVSSTGFVTPKRAGTVAITVKSKANPAVKAIYKVNVRNLVTGIEFNRMLSWKVRLEREEGEPKGDEEGHRYVGFFNTKMQTIPDNAENKNFIVTSDNENVVKIDHDIYDYGFLLISKGTAHITVKSEDGFFVGTWEIIVCDEDVSCARP